MVSPVENRCHTFFNKLLWQGWPTIFPSGGGLRIFVHDISDDDDDRRQTEKSLTQVDKQISGKEAKLDNEKFLKNAKPEIVDAERKRLETLITQRNALRAHMAELDS